jgi:hypothetical protein
LPTTTNKWQFFFAKVFTFFNKKGLTPFYFILAMNFGYLATKKGMQTIKRIFLENAYLVTRFQGGKKVELTIFKA